MGGWCWVVVGGRWVDGWLVLDGLLQVMDGFFENWRIDGLLKGVFIEKKCQLFKWIASWRTVTKTDPR